MRRGGEIVLLIFAILLLFIGSASPLRAQADKPPQRIVSINLCADQYMLALADPSQILALSPFADDPALSFFADRAVGLAKIRDDAETVLKLKPDLVLASTYSRPQTLKLLRTHGIKLHLIPPPKSLWDVPRQVQETATVIGQRVRGEKIAKALTLLLNEPHERQSPVKTALHYQRGRYISGSGTLMDGLMAHFGLENMATRYVEEGSSSLSLEKLITMPPDLLILSDHRGRKDDQGTLLLVHPALERAFPRDRQMILPIPSSVCSGPQLISVMNAFKKKLL